MFHNTCKRTKNIFFKFIGICRSRSSLHTGDSLQGRSARFQRMMKVRQRQGIVTTVLRGVWNPKPDVHALLHVNFRRYRFSVVSVRHTMTRLEAFSSHDTWRCFAAAARWLNTHVVVTRFGRQLCHPFCSHCVSGVTRTPAVHARKGVSNLRLLTVEREEPLVLAHRFLTQHYYM